MIGLVTDSNSQIPTSLTQRYGIAVVPLTVTLDDVEYVEGVDIDADGFYAHFEQDRPPPTVSTSQPRPARFEAAYQALVAAGAEAILSVHIGSALSGTVNSAQLAARAVSVPVRIVDTMQASFAVACCVWEAAEALAAGATLEQAADTAEAVSRRIGNVFVVGALDLARAGGRLAGAAAVKPEGQASSDAIPVLSLTEGAMRQVGEVSDTETAADVMASSITESGTHLRVGVGMADEATAGLRDALEARLHDRPEVDEVVRYRIGPSVGVHTGPGTVGAFYYERSRTDPATSSSGRRPTPR